MSDEDILTMSVMYPEFVCFFNFSKCVSLVIHPSSNDTYIPLFDNKVIVFDNAVFYLHKKWPGLRQSNYRKTPGRDIKDAQAVQLIENNLHLLIY